VNIIRGPREPNPPENENSNTIPNNAAEENVNRGRGSLLGELVNIAKSFVSSLFPTHQVPPNRAA